jgi:uncharacterized protein
MVDRESAYEILLGRAEQSQRETERTDQEKRDEFARKRAEQQEGKAPKRHTDGILEAFGKSAARSIGSALTGGLIRGILHNLFGGSKRR